jgi:hypothetical protein
VDEGRGHEWRGIRSLKFYHRHIGRQDVRDKSTACARRPAQAGLWEAGFAALACIIAYLPSTDSGATVALNILNIAAYRFVALDRLPRLRAVFKARDVEQRLKGTILVATEGINLFLAGAASKSSRKTLAFAALTLGAAAMAFGPIFTRPADTGSSARSSSRVSQWSPSFGFQLI